MYLPCLYQFFFNKLQALVQGCTKIPGGECHRHRNWDTEFMYQFVWGQGRGNRSGTSVDVQVSWHDLTAHAQRLLPPKWRSRWSWCHFMWCHHHTAYVDEGGYKKEAHTSPRGDWLVCILGVLVQVQEEEATDPLSQLPWCLSRSGIITIQGSVLCLFIWPICVQG